MFVRIFQDPHDRLSSPLLDLKLDSPEATPPPALGNNSPGAPGPRKQFGFLAISPAFLSQTPVSPPTTIVSPNRRLLGSNPPGPSPAVTGSADFGRTSNVIGMHAPASSGSNPPCGFPPPMTPVRATTGGGPPPHTAQLQPHSHYGPSTSHDGNTYYRSRMNCSERATEESSGSWGTVLWVMVFRIS